MAGELQVTLRVQEATCKRADALKTKMVGDPKLTSYGVHEISRSGVLKIAIERGLQSMEEEWSHVTPRRRGTAATSHDER